MKNPALVTALLMGMTCGLSGQLETVRLQLKWLHQFQFAGYYAAIERGYYEEEGLHVELMEAEYGENPMEAVWDGRAEYGVSTSDIVLYRALGKPVVALAVIYQHSPYILLGVYGDDLDNLHDLAGRKLMMEPNSADLYALLSYEGVDIDQVTLVPHTFQADDLLEGKVAAMSAYLTDEPYSVRAADRKPVIFTPRMAGIDFYGDGLFTTESEIKENPERVKRFLRASLRGWSYALRNQEEIVDLIIAKYSDRKTREQLLYEANRTFNLVRPDLVEIGYMYPGRWSHIVDTFREVGFIEGDFDLMAMLYRQQETLPWRRIIFFFSAILLVLLVVILVAMRMYYDRRKLSQEVIRRSRSESILSKMEERYRELFFGAPMSFMIFDSDLLIKEWNREAERMFGWSREEVLGKDFFTFLIPSEERKRVQSAVSSILGDGVFSMSNWNLTKSGRKIWCKWHNVAQRNEKGEFEECHSIAVDLTMEYENEQRLRHAKVAAESMNEKKDIVMAQVSHEIRNPLNAIIGCSDLLREQLASEESVDLLQTIESSAQSLVEMLNDLLDFSKIEAGRLDVEFEKVSINECIEKCIYLYRVIAVQKGLEFIWKPRDGEDFVVQTDPFRFTQILRNLISNAIKFTHNGCVKIDAGWAIDESGARTLEVKVTDTGVGIATEDVENIFKPYTQAGNRIAGLQGTGLGLALCKELARLLGGRIEVASTIGKGSTFSLFLPTRLQN